MVHLNVCTFLWQKLLIVELWVFAQYIFSICVMFSLPLWMASVYCELPLEDSVWDQISLTQWFLLVCLFHMFICSILRRLGWIFFLGAPSVTAVNKDYNVERSILNLSELFLPHCATFKQEDSELLGLIRAVCDHLCCGILWSFFGKLAPLECRWW